MGRIRAPTGSPARGPGTDEEPSPVKHDLPAATAGWGITEPVDIDAFFVSANRPDEIGLLSDYDENATEPIGAHLSRNGVRKSALKAPFRACHSGRGGDLQISQRFRPSGEDCEHDKS